MPHQVVSRVTRSIGNMTNRRIARCGTPEHSGVQALSASLTACPLRTAARKSHMLPAMCALAVLCYRWEAAAKIGYCWRWCVQVALDLRQYGIYRALPVYGEPDFDSGPPTTAEEYLRRVRWARHACNLSDAIPIPCMTAFPSVINVYSGDDQACARQAGSLPSRFGRFLLTLPSQSMRFLRRYEAQRLPDVVTSAIDPRAYDARRTAYAPAAEAVPRAPDFARPSRQWLREFLTDFQAVREHLARWATRLWRLLHDVKPFTVSGRMLQVRQQLYPGAPPCTPQCHAGGFLLPRSMSRSSPMYVTPPNKLVRCAARRRPAGMSACGCRATATGRHGTAFASGGSQAALPRRHRLVSTAATAQREWSRTGPRAASSRPSPCCSPWSR